MEVSMFNANLTSSLFLDCKAVWIWVLYLSVKQTLSLTSIPLESSSSSESTFKKSVWHGVAGNSGCYFNKYLLNFSLQFLRLDLVHHLGGQRHKFKIGTENRCVVSKHVATSSVQVMCNVLRSIWAGCWCSVVIRFEERKLKIWIGVGMVINRGGAKKHFMIRIFLHKVK